VGLDQHGSDLHFLDVTVANADSMSIGETLLSSVGVTFVTEIPTVGRTGWADLSTNNHAILAEFGIAY